MRYLFFGLAAACLIVGLTLDSLPLGRRSQRRTYWACAGLAAVCGFLAVYPTWKTGLAVGALLSGAMITIAYAATPYLKIGGTIHALTIANSRPDPDDTHAPADHPQPQPDEALAANPAPHHDDPAPNSYSGLLTPTTMWWSLVVLAGLAATNVYAYLFSDGKASVAAVGAALLAFLAITVGYGDASWGYPLARGKYLPLGIASLLTVGSFALIYLTAYYTGRRIPLRRNQSLDYRTHPRHHKNPP